MRAERRLRTRGGESYLDGFRELDERRRTLLKEGETLKALRNSVSDEIGRTKDKSLVQDKILEMREVSHKIKGLDEELNQVDEQLQSFLLTVPNLPHATTPIGTSENDNVQVRTWGDPQKLPFEAKPHWDLGEDLGILDFERGAKITGARFTLYRGAGARLERALINFDARSAHRHAWLPGGAAPLHGQSRFDAGHRTAPQVRGGPLQAGRPRVFSDSDRRGAGHQYPSRRDS